MDCTELCVDTFKFSDYLISNIAYFFNPLSPNYYIQGQGSLHCVCNIHIIKYK